MVKSGTLPFVFDTQLPTRFGVLPRYAENEDDIKWFEVPAVMMFHVANAWQEGNTIRLSSCCFDQVQLHVLFAQPAAALLLTCQVLLYLRMNTLQRHMCVRETVTRLSAKLYFSPVSGCVGVCVDHVVKLSALGSTACLTMRSRSVGLQPCF